MKRFGMAALCVASGACQVVAQSPDQVAAMGCRNGVAQEARVQRPDADSVTIGAVPVVTRRKRGELTVSGDGHILARGQRQWLSFSYTCAYRPHSAKTEVTLTFANPSASP